MRAPQPLMLTASPHIKAWLDALHEEWAGELAVFALPGIGRMDPMTTATRLPAAAVRVQACFPVAARNLVIRSAGTRPRSLTSRPFALAQSRTSVVFSPFAVALPGALAGRRL